MIGHDSRVNSAACSPDGQRIVTASYDGTVQIYTTDIDKLLEIPRAELPVN
ncbi:MAG: WD40 repeat domain-containing protein [Candidatus Poribacteria bacterium]|nr:WD40 repeat domain-containing protein [Candidatus Poribacteria bacterium]